ncbi:MAG TPA: hypothetical protein VFX33_14955 [Actinomycetales bacterium]|nr:hypothetical protein [Actinomycetales bacterium]
MSNAVVEIVIAAGPNINSQGVVGWAVRNIIPIVLLVIGIGIIASARKGQMSQNAMTITNVMLGLGVIAGAAVFYGFAGSIVNFVFKG